MAEQWLKVRHSLVRSAKVRALMRLLRCKKHAALGLAVSWLVWIDEQTTDGLTHLLPDELDDEIGFRGGAEALIGIGWAALGEDGCVYALEFGKHCGDSAKERAQGARRVERHRGRKDGNAECNAECNAFTVTETLPEKNRIDIDGKVGGCSTVDIGAPVVQPTPQPGVDDGGYGAWVARVCGVVPELCRLRTLPPDVDAAARVMFGTGFVPTDAGLQALGRFMAAPADGLHGLRRPGAFRWLFEDLPDVVNRAMEWLRVEARRQRRAAATSRRRAQEVDFSVIRDDGGALHRAWQELKEEEE